MNILITGAKGFIGKNLVAALENVRDGKDSSVALPPDLRIMEYDIDSSVEMLDAYCAEADFVFNLAGVNRPEDQNAFMRGNYGFASDLLVRLEQHHNNCPVMLSSSIQATQDNPYGESKKAGEDLFFTYGKRTGARVLVYRFPNVFGKWCRPNYNSVIATFCHNIAHGLPITVNDPNAMLTLVYIDDLVAALLDAIAGRTTMENGFCTVPLCYMASVGEIAELIRSFHDGRSGSGERRLSVPDVGDAFTRKLYATYLSYLPEDAFSYPLQMHCDERGGFTELIRTAERGQYSVNITRPGVTKGNHWHNTKNEKFIVVYGTGMIRFRKVGEEKIISYPVNGEKIEVVDIPTGYTHSITNTGDIDLITLMWASEPFDPLKPDTYYLEVEDAKA